MKKNLIMLACLTLTACYQTQEGDKVGTVTKLAKQGVIIGTWEGQIIRGGLAGGSGGFGQSFEFTVEKPEVLAQLQSAMNAQQEVKIHYHKEAITLWRSESGDYFVDSVQVLGPTK
jgi:hypothetical protein